MSGWLLDGESLNARIRRGRLATRMMQDTA
jgi:hypothetical protein